MLLLPQIVLDTNVLVSALRSKRGASHRLLLLVDSGKFEINLSVPVALEYEEVSKRLCREGKIDLSEDEVDDILNYLLACANRHQVHYLWRPRLPDPDDEMVLELAIAAHCNAIVTFNKRDFREAKQFGIKIQTPQELLREIGEIP